MSNTSRRERPAKPALTRAGIVDTAVGIMRAEGLGKLTMRRLAQELDTGPASLYVYLSNTAELHAEVLDVLLGTVDLDPPGKGWRERLIALLTSYFLLLKDNPSLASATLVIQPSGPHYLALVDRVLGLLDEGGVPSAQAVWGVDILLHFATASAVEKGTRQDAIGAEDEFDALTAAVRAADPDRYPHIAAVGVELVAGWGRVAWGFDVLLTGIAGTPRPT